MFSFFFKLQPLQDKFNAIFNNLHTPILHEHEIVLYIPTRNVPII